MKAEKGITLVALIITIAIMIILAGVGINVTSDMQEQINFQEFKTKLDILQIEVVEKYDSIEEEKKKENKFIEYTPTELENFGFTKQEQNAYINWNTRQVKMNYKGQEYFSEKYNVQSNAIKESNTNFDMDISYEENRYKVKIIPEENSTGLEVSYRIKVAAGQKENRWIIANGYEFEYADYGIYEVRLKDRNGNETIKVIDENLNNST